MPDSKRDYVNSLARGLEVIRAFTRAKPRMTLSELAHETGMTRATVRRFLLTLVREEYAETDGKYFSLAPKILELGHAVLSSMTFLDVVQPVMVQLARSLNESCFASVLEGEDVVYVANAAPPDRIVNISVSVGSRAPAHSVSSGRVLVAALPDDAQARWLKEATLEKLTENTVTSRSALRKLLDETRRQGYSIVDQELEVGLRSISVPITNGNGEVLAALNVACPSSRITPEEMRGEVLEQLQAATTRITERLAS